MSRHRCNPANPCRACEDRAEERDYESADPITEADWDRMESGPLWNWPAEL